MIELMLGLFLASILLLLGLPNYKDFASKQVMRTASMELVGALHYAKSEAVQRGAWVTVCKGDSSGCAAGGDWKQGWVIFRDSDRDGVLDSGELLQFQEPLNASIKTFGATAGATSSVTFNTAGRSTLTSPQTFVMCDERGFGDHARAIHLTVFGTATVHKATETAATACL
jgi:type IV fimbrial biogenesis protein FimT